MIATSVVQYGMNTVPAAGRCVGCSERISTSKLHNAHRAHTSRLDNLSIIRFRSWHPEGYSQRVRT